MNINYYTIADILNFWDTNINFLKTLDPDKDYVMVKKISRQLNNLRTKAALKYGYVFVDQYLTINDKLAKKYKII